MSSDRPTLVARNVHVTFRSYLDPKRGLRELAKRGRASTRRRFVEVEAVRGVDLRLNEGESVGIVGHNGAGKSTLLLGLAGLLELDSGEVLARSRPTLLGVGAALNPSLSGRRNIEQGCLAVGMTNAEIHARMDELVDFAGLRQFIDLPLKTYSTGMRARLVFTVATVAEPEILLIDEALAVGDKAFRGQAIDRIDSLRRSAGSVVIVSHNVREIARMCSRAVWMDHGRVVADGPVDEIVDRYESADVGLDRRHQR